MAAWVQWFHPNGGTSPSKLVLVVIEEASATAQAMVKSGAPSVNHAVLGQALSALSESHPSTRVSFSPRPPLFLVRATYYTNTRYSRAL